MKHYNMSRKKQCTSVPCIERNRNAILHFNTWFINTIFTKQLAALSFAFLWLSFLSASSFDFVIPINNSQITHQLVDCDSLYSFSSDTLKTYYRDSNPRSSIITFCPQDPSRRLGVLFREFDLFPGDTLFAYDGPDTNAPLLDKASGKGIESAFGGAVFVSFNRNTNISSCITFEFRTNGDRESGMGWVADIQCCKRIANFIPPHIPSQQLDCGSEFINVTIPAAEMLVECFPLQHDSAMVRIIETTSGLICGETCLSFEAGMQLPNPFGVGTYEISYHAILDSSITTSVQFEVKAPELICKQEVIVNTNTNCEITIFPEMVIEDYCFPIRDILHYNILIKDVTGTIIANGSTLTEEYPSFPPDAMITCGNAGYTVEIQRVYTANQASAVCASNKVVDICSSPLIIQDQSIPFFTEGPRTDTLYTCNFDIEEILNNITTPNTVDACGTSNVILESTTVIGNNTTCDTPSSYLLHWLVTDACNNSARKTDTLIIQDQSIPFFTEGPRTDTLYTCNFNIDDVLINMAPPIAMDECGTTIVTLESTSIIETMATCNAQPSYALNWLVTDACNNTARRVDTLRVLRPDVRQLINIPLDITADCALPTTDINNRTEDNPIGLLSGLQINGQFQATDTLFFDENNPTCDFRLQVRDIGAATDCGAVRQRIYELIDQCDPQGIVVLVDTQFIQIIDTIAPTFTTCSFSALANAEQIVLPANSCQISLDFPLPEATDNCDDKPIVKEFTVQELVNREWSNKAISVFQTSFSIGTFRIGYEASDQCGALSNRDTCFRYLTIRDTIAPIAICQNNQEIILDDNGMATLSANELNNNSSDNCGITQILIKRSNCTDGEMRLDTTPLLRDSIDLSEWSMEVSFECCDLFKDVLLELLVIDGSGNYNVCTTIVNPIDRTQPSCMALGPITRSCGEFQTTDIGRPTDLDGDNQFDMDEWLPLFPTQAFFFNQQFGDPGELCMDNMNCITPIIEQEYQLLEGNCQTLQIKRRYRAIDRSGNTTPWLEQSIDFIYEPDWVITFPADEFTNCDIDKIEVPPSPIQEGACDDFTWTYRDLIVRFESGNIQHITRTYSIVNQCLTNVDDQWLTIGREADDDDIVRSPNIITASQFPEEDHFTYVQIIRFVDNDAPFLVVGEVDNVLLGKGDAAPFGEEDQTLGSSPLECDDNRNFSIFARDCNELSTDGLRYNWQFLQNGTLVDTGTSPSFLQTVLPDTSYTVIWQVVDEFGNQSDTTVQYQFIDGVAPTPRCARGVIATIDSIERMVIVHTDSLDAGSYDNCNDQSELNFFLWHESLRVDTPSVLTEVQMLPSQIAFTCADEGIVELILFVVDATGNYNSCPIQIDIQSPIGIDCDETMVGGTITDRFGAPIADTKIDITSTSTSYKTTLSNEAGNFQMMLPSNSDYTIAPSNNTNPLNGVSTFDLLLINKHIIGTSIFTLPYQYIAADVNRSGTITTYDMVIIRQMILGKMTQFPNNKSWRFINKDYQFQTSNPLAEVIEESYTVSALNTDNVYMDFIGVKIGDINGDAASSYSAATSRNFGTSFYIHTPELKVERGKTYTIPFYAPELEKIAGFQATFKFHDLILTNKIGGIVTPDNIHGWRKGQEGFLTTSWHSLLSHDNNTVLFSLTFEATADGQLNELLSVTSDPTPAEAYSFSGHWLDFDLKFQSPDSINILDFGSMIAPSPSFHQEHTTPMLDSEGGAFNVSQNTPNPFATTTTIHFYLPQEALTALSVFNIHGQNILQTTQHYSKGTNQIKFVSDHLPNGTYFYQVATPFGVATHKMIIAK